jgi:hypothetical protein
MCLTDWCRRRMRMRVKGHYFQHLSYSLCFNWAPHHEGVLGSGGIAPRILDLGTKWRWLVSFTLRPLYPQGKSPWYPWDRRLGGLQSRSGRGGEKKIPLPHRDSNPIIQPVAHRCTTELSRLLTGSAAGGELLPAGSREVTQQRLTSWEDVLHLNFKLL